MSARLHERGEKDLFDQFQAADKKIGRKTRSFLPRLKSNIALSYENIIFIAIGFIMSCIIFFSLGVEKGRQDAGRIENRRQRTEDRRQKREVNVIKSGREADRLETREETIGGAYIIQLAAFAKIGSAEREAEKLRREGYNISIKRSGGYYQLYIGGFKERETAERVMNKLKGAYEDCYIKKIGG